MQLVEVYLLILKLYRIFYLFFFFLIGIYCFYFNLVIIIKLGPSKTFNVWWLKNKPSIRGSWLFSIFFILVIFLLILIRSCSYISCSLGKFLSLDFKKLLFSHLIRFSYELLWCRWGGKWITWSQSFIIFFDWVI